MNDLEKASAESAFATFTTRIDTEIQMLNDNLGALQKVKDEIQSLLYGKFDPYTEVPWWIKEPSKFKDLEFKLGSSTALIIDLLIDIEAIKGAVKPVQEETPIQVAPHLQVNVPSATTSPPETGKSYGMWSFLHDMFDRPKLQSNGGPSRIVQDKEIYSVIENLKQIPALLNKLDDWFDPTVLERTLYAPTPEGYLFENQELRKYMSKILRQLDSAIPAARRLKDKLIRFESQMARTYIEATAARAGSFQGGQQRTRAEGSLA